MATNNKKNPDPAADVQQEATAPESGEKQGLSLSDVQAAIAKMMAEAQAQADAIIADAEKRVKSYVAVDEDAEKRRAREQAKKENLAWGEELVRIKLFQDGDKYKDDRFVQCNGESCLIKRGVWVDVKRKFVEILDNSEYQDARTNEMIARLDGHSEKLADL